MPRKDREKRLAYQREWYARPENRQRTIQKVKERKHTMYAGVCVNCGDPTVGNSKGTASDYCSKPECIKVLWYEKMLGLRPPGRRRNTPSTTPSGRAPSNSPPHATTPAAAPPLDRSGNN